MNPTMNQTILRKIDHHGHSADTPSDTQRELTRHCFDLRIHALIMIGTAVLATYCGYRASGASNDGITDDPGSIAMSPDLLSICACLAFVAISVVCLVEAHRFWKKAAIIRLQTKVGSRSIVPNILRNSRKAVVSPLQTLKEC
jgi:hypothetical protein